MRYTSPMSSNDYIIVVDSRDLGDDATNTDTNIHEEADEASLRALEKQGIFLEESGDAVFSTEPRDNFSKELQDISGIEIVHEDDDEAFS